MNSLEVLQKMRLILDKPGSWTKGALARDSTQKSIKPQDPKACQFCLYGALAIACKEDNYAAEKVEQILVPICEDNIADFNDNLHTKHRDILCALDEAISKCSTSQS